MRSEKQEQEQSRRSKKQDNEKERNVGRNVSNAKVRVKQSDVEKLMEKRQKARLKREEQARKEMEEREKKYQMEKAKEAAKKKKAVTKMVVKRKKERAKRAARRKKAQVKAEEEEEAVEVEEKVEEKEPEAPVVQETAAAVKEPRYRPGQRLVRRIQRVASNSRMAIPGRYLRIPPDLKLSRKDMKLARAFLQFPPPSAFPFKAGWPWTTAGDGENVLVADSDCEKALRHHQQRQRLQKRLARQPKDLQLARKLRALNRPGHSFLERYSSQVAPLGEMPGLVSGHSAPVQLSRRERKRYLDMSLSMCPKEELAAWCEARKPFYFSPGRIQPQVPSWRAEEDLSSDSEASEADVELFLKEEARQCVQRVREKAGSGREGRKMMHRLLQRFDELPTPLDIAIGSRAFLAMQDCL